MTPTTPELSGTTKPDYIYIASGTVGGAGTYIDDNSTIEFHTSGSNLMTSIKAMDAFKAVNEYDALCKVAEAAKTVADDLREYYLCVSSGEEELNDALSHLAELRKGK